MHDGHVTYTIREPSPGDATAIADLHVSTFDGVEQTDPHAPAITDARMIR